MRAFVIAMENEAAVVRPFLKDGDRLYVAGVGKVNAAAATQKAIDAGADEIINCGVAGGLDPAMEASIPRWRWASHTRYRRRSSTILT